MASLSSPLTLSSHVDSPASGLWLEVRRGRTRAPQRAVRGRRFLIGAGSNCQLQLGGNEIPILHSILLVGDQGAHIDAMVSSPQLLVNGSPQRTADLRDGDVFSIGKFEFAVHVPQSTATVQVASPAVGEAPLAGMESEEELTALTAAELVSKIEADEAHIDRFESSRIMGARALLQAAAAARGEFDEDEQTAAAALLEELHALSRELDRRAELLAEREAACADRADTLLNFHDRIAGQVEQLASQVHETETADVQRRAS